MIEPFIYPAATLIAGVDEVGAGRWSARWSPPP